MESLKCSDIIQRLAKDYSITQVEVEPYVYATFDTLIKLIAEGHDLHIHGLGKFLIKESKPKKVKHPKTREDLVIPSHCYLDFTPVFSMRKTVAELPLREE